MLRKEKKWFTDIMDFSEHATIQKELFDDPYYKNEKKAYYLVQDQSRQFVLKVCQREINDKERVKQAKNEHGITINIREFTPNALQPVSLKEKRNEEAGIVYIESLYACKGRQLSELIGSLTPMEILDIAKKLIEPLSLIESINYYCDVTPCNVLYGDDTVELIDLMTSTEIEEKFKSIKTAQTLSKEVIGYTPAYCPPEVHSRYSIDAPKKINVYCWAMTIYQLFTAKSAEELANETANYKTPGKDYNLFTASIERGDFMGKEGANLNEFIVAVLVQALNKDPGKRPRFSDLRQKFRDMDPAAYYDERSCDFDNLSDLGSLSSEEMCEEEKERGPQSNARIFAEYEEEKKQSKERKSVLEDLAKNYSTLEEEWDGELKASGLLDAGFDKRIFEVSFLDLAGEIARMPSVLRRQEEIKQKYIKKVKDISEIERLFGELKKERNKYICIEVKRAYNSLLKNKLKNLDMWDKDISDAGAQIIAKGISKCSNLMHLNVAYCRITTEGMKALRSVLAGSQRLATLVLGSSQSNRSCMMRNFLNGTQSCHDIALLENTIQGEGAKAVAEVLRSCKSLFTVSVGFCNTNEDEDQVSIIRAVNENGCIGMLHIWGYNKAMVKKYLRRDLIVYGP